MPSIKVGPPDSVFGGMNTRFRRQQLSPNLFHMLRNVEIEGESLKRRDGVVRLVVGTEPTESYQSNGGAGSYITIPQSDTTDIVDYNLGTRWTIFVSYSLQSLASDALVAADGAANHPWSIVHNTDGTITVAVQDQAGNTATITTTKTFTLLDTELQLWVVRSGGTVSVYVNADAAKSDTTTLESTSDTLATTGNFYLASWSGRASGSAITYHELRIFRDAYTEDTWRLTQYPWTGAFGDPNLILHLVFEDGAGSTITDYSRNKNESIVSTGTWTWLGTTLRQAIAPVTGLYVMENTRGRKWLIADSGKNHYRVPLN